MNIRRLIIIISIGISCALLTACQSKLPPVNTAPQVDLARYMGTWYEIASLPNYFQKHCQCTNANYTLKQNYVAVTNTCRKGDFTSDWKQAHAKAFAVAGSNNSKLKVQFFWPIKADYWILYVSPDYQYALVGTPNRNYLWILARTPVISADKFNELKAMAIKEHYKLDQLGMTRQDCYKK